MSVSPDAAKGHTRVFASMLVRAIKIKLVTAAQAEPLQILDVTTGGGVAAEASLLTFRPLHAW